MAAKGELFCAGFRRRAGWLRRFCSSALWKAAHKAEHGKIGHGSGEKGGICKLRMEIAPDSQLVDQDFWLEP